MINLYIDFDGVILDTINTTYRIMEAVDLDRSNEEVTQQFYKNLDWKHVIEVTPELNDALSCITKIINSGRFDVAILTHVHSLNEVVEKVNFIRNNLGSVTVIPVPKQISKTKMVSAKDAILIDDYSGNLKEWEEAGGIGVRFSLELEDKGYIVIDRLDQILEYTFSKRR